MIEAAKPERVRVAVFIDWQNAYRSARTQFGMEHMPNEEGNFSPLRLARLLAYGNGRGPGAVADSPIGGLPTFALSTPVLPW
jgi:hypothetical protein